MPEETTSDLQPLDVLTPGVHSPAHEVRSALDEQALARAFAIDAQHLADVTAVDAHPIAPLEAGNSFVARARASADRARPHTLGEP